MRILLAIDDSECSTAAVKAVIDQFRPAHTQVTVLHADDWPNGIPPSMAFAEGSSASHSILAFHKLRRSNAAAQLEAVAEQLRREGFTVAASLRDGDPRHTIVDCAREWRADLIVLGSHGKKGLDRMLGSVSDSVARHAPCSVEIVRARPTAA
jgi:nucleotide-binding universal stress UspA family protein